MTAIATRTDASKPALRAGGAIASIVPQTLEEAYRLSDAIHQAGMAPFGLDTPQKVMIAMMTGLELEMPPMQAVQSIAVINNRPCMWGDALIGVVRKSPLCLWVREWIEGQGDDRIAYCETKRKGEEQPVVRSFSVDDAKRAKLWSTDAIVTKRSKNGGTYDKENDSPWYRYPQRMLQMRARAWCLRDTYADVLKGMQVREEVEDYQHEPAPAAVELRREPSRFAARLTAEPASDPQAAVEGFRQDFIDTELGARPGGDTGTADASANAPDQDAINDAGDIDPDAPAASHDEASEREADHAESSANRDPVIRNLLTECAAKLLSIAAGSGEPQGRAAALTAAKDAWKSELPDNLVDLKRIFDRTYAVITGKSNVAAAVQLLATELGLKASEIQPEAN